jgi:PAS domain S-box-containing protein
MPVEVVETTGGLDPEVFRVAIEASPSGMLVSDAHGRIVLVNSEVERLFGYDRAELVGRPVESLLLGKLPRLTAAEADAAIDADSCLLRAGGVFTAQRKDGSEFTVEVALNPCRVGDALMVVSAIVDVSQRKLVERQQDEFVSIASHELRTPMTSIAASLGLLLAGGAKGLPPPATHLLEIAYANCGRLIRLINDILDIKKLEAGQMPFRFERCDAQTLLEKAIDANRAFAGTVGVRLDAPESVALYVDPDRFAQVITNLLSNALKFSPPGGVVDIAAEERGNNVRITVRDRGPGIPDEFKPQVFDKFTQADSAGGQPKGGTGLGLSIAREIVMRMHGEIGFDDAAGGGTVFYVDLPQADHAEQWHAGLVDGANPAMFADATQRAS